MKELLPRTTISIVAINAEIAGEKEIKAVIKVYDKDNTSYIPVPMTANTFGSMGCTIERMLIAEAMKIVEESDVFGLQAKFEKSIELDNIRFINRCALSI